jgi:hypothetical protein
MKSTGFARILITLYGILALAAIGRSTYQILTKYNEAPLAYSLSAVAAIVYLLVTIAIAAKWKGIATVAMVFELIGVLSVGMLTLIDPVLFPADTVWSRFGQGYAFIPVVLPIAGLWWTRESK